MHCGIAGEDRQRDGITPGEFAARTFTALEEASPCRIAGDSDGGPEVVSCLDIAPAAELQFADRGLVKRIRCEPLAVGNGCNFRQSALRALNLSDRDGAIQGYDWGWGDGHQGIVELDYPAPVSLGRISSR